MFNCCFFTRKKPACKINHYKNINKYAANQTTSQLNYFVILQISFIFSGFKNPLFQNHSKVSFQILEHTEPQTL